MPKYASSFRMNKPSKLGPPRTVRLSEKEWRELRRLAASQDDSAGKLIRKAVRMYLASAGVGLERAA